MKRFTGSISPKTSDYTLMLSWNMSSDLAELIKHNVGIRSLRKNPNFLRFAAFWCWWWMQDYGASWWQVSTKSQSICQHVNYAHRSGREKMACRTTRIQRGMSFFPGDRYSTQSFWNPKVVQPFQNFCRVTNSDLNCPYFTCWCTPMFTNLRELPEGILLLAQQMDKDVRTLHDRLSVVQGSNNVLDSN